MRASGIAARSSSSSVCRRRRDHATLSPLEKRCSFSGDCFSEGGFRQDGNARSVPADAAVVMFESAPDDALGAHSPVLTGEHYAIFPPNTLFRLKSVQSSFTAPNGVLVRQKLLTVTATYRKPQVKQWQR